MILKIINLNTLLKPLGYLIAIPAVIIIRLISPFFLIRWYCTYSTRIGHYAENIQIYLAMKAQKKIFHSNKKFFDIFYNRKHICNKQLNKMWSRNKNLFFLPYWIMDPINNLNEFVLDKVFDSKSIHYIGYYYDPKKIIDHKVIPLECVDTFNCIDKADYCISFTDKEIEYGNKQLNKMGINKSDKFVILVLRNPDYLNREYPNIDWKRHDNRDTKLDYYLETIKFLDEKNYKVILIGSGAAKYKDLFQKNIINYENSELKSEFLDIFLFSKNNCKFVISSITGIDAFSPMFKKYILEIGVVPFCFARTYSKYYSFIFKKYYSKSLDRYLTMKEIFELGLSQTLGDQLNDEIEFIHPNSEEILSSTKELLSKLENNFHSNEEGKKLQLEFSKKYKLYIDKYHPERTNEAIPGMVSEIYILQNKYLLN
ncbi:MAG: hypothetical protein CMF54_07070 [Legionellales bacterium]|nr:hypothetical protein [Legionellales bacterium]